MTKIVPTPDLFDVLGDVAARISRLQGDYGCGELIVWSRHEAKLREMAAEIDETLGKIYDECANDIEVRHRPIPSRWFE